MYEKRCDFCNKKNPEKLDLGAGEIEMQLDFTYKEVDLNIITKGCYSCGGTTKYVEANFCLKCGRKLKREGIE